MYNVHILCFVMPPENLAFLREVEVLGLAGPRNFPVSVCTDGRNQRD